MNENIRSYTIPELRAALKEREEKVMETMLKSMENEYKTASQLSNASNGEFSPRAVSSLLFVATRRRTATMRIKTLEEARRCIKSGKITVMRRFAEVDANGEIMPDGVSYEKKQVCTTYTYDPENSIKKSSKNQ